MEEIRNRIKEIESKILAITGNDIERYSHWTENAANRDIVEALLKQRCNLLNDMFQPTAENIARLKRVNDYLFDRTCFVHQRVGEINATKNHMASSDDDDQEIEGWLRFVFNGEDSVLRLDDDSYYGSDFTIMIKVLSELYEAKGHGNIIYDHGSGINNLDDGQSWMDAPLWRWEDELKDTVICYAVHDLTNHKDYSIPDLLRLNDFWVEARITFQSITAQDGTRWKKE